MSGGRGYGAKGSRTFDGAVDEWCAALNLKCARTLESDTVRPLDLSNEGVGRFDFDVGLMLPKTDEGPKPIPGLPMDFS